MSELLTSVVAFVVAISVLVAIHEYGHYLVGRLCGMKVLRYSIGFGKPLWTRVAGKDRTEYCISTIPLGGYVKFLDEREGPVEVADQGRAFDHRPVWQRILVLLAGPAFNFLFAIVAYWLLFMVGVPAVQPAVGAVSPDSYAAAAGLHEGDRILQVGQRDTEDWESALVAMLDNLVSDGRVTLRLADEAGHERTTTLEVGDNASALTEPGKLFDGIGFKPWTPPPVVGEVQPESAAEQAGLLPGDRIVMVDGKDTPTIEAVRQALQPHAGEAVRIGYRRGGDALAATATLGRSSTDDGREVGRLGVKFDASMPSFFHIRRYGPLASIGESMSLTWTTTAFTVRMLARMVTGEVSVRNISGPINIAQFAGESAAGGPGQFLRFLALVSISLGVLNLLPVPVLDGGQIVYQSVELVKGSPLSERSQLMGQQAGILALLLLMSFAFYNDISRLFS